MIFEFGEFELDTQLYELRRNGRVCDLEPQVFNVLRYLIEHPDHVVSKDELLENLWPGRVVSESALTSRLKTARQVIGDSGREQRFIKTLHGRGYRFVGAVKQHADSASAAFVVEGNELPAAVPRPPVEPAPLGRERELALLSERFSAAVAGEPQLVFIEGEAGVGKTTLVAAFVAQLQATDAALVAIGQCVERSAAGEAYMPVLDALDGLCRGPHRDAVVACLKQVAPTWLLQLPMALSAEERRDLEQRLIGVTQDRMLREFAAAGQALGALQPLVLVLEDLHWGDPSTLSLLAWLGRRREAARMLVVCSHRPSEAADAGQSSLTETVYGLRLRGLARVVGLAALTVDDVRGYLAQRFPGCEFPPALVAALHGRTDGNPLFLVSVIEHWLERGVLVGCGESWQLDADRAAHLEVIPDNLRLLLGEQFRHLAPERRRLLDAASVVGNRFSAALLESLLGRECEQCEAQLAALAATAPFIAREADMEWPDGTVTSQFRFTHMLYRDALYGELPPRQRSRMHTEVAARLERAFGPQAVAHAVELAEHFTLGAQPDKAVSYRLAAAQQAFGRGGYREAINQIERGFELLERHPTLSDRDRSELGLQLLLASARIQTNGWSDGRAEAALKRALGLAEALDDERLPSVLYALAAVHELRGEYAATEGLLERQRALSKPFETPLADLESHELMACSTYHQGDFDKALHHAEAGLQAADAIDVDTKLYIYGENPRVSCHNWAGLALWFLGFPEQARLRIEQGLALARKPIRRYSLSNALCQAATLHQLRREPEPTLKFAQEAIDVAVEEGFKYPLAAGQILKGWALTMTGHAGAGVSLIIEGLEQHRASGAQMDRPYYLGQLAEAYCATEQWALAERVVADALAQIDGSRRFFQEAELLRLSADCALALNGGSLDRGLQRLLRSLATATAQRNRIAELRAECALVRLSGDPAQRRAHLRALRRVYSGFTEGFETPDLRDAQALLG